MFEALDESTPPEPIELDAMRAWRTGRVRKTKRVGAMASMVAVVSAGWFGFASSPDSNAVVSSDPKVDVTPTTAAVVNPNKLAPVVLEPASGAPAPEAGADDDTPAPAQPGSAPASPGDSAEPPAAPGAPSDAPSDPGTPPAEGADPAPGAPSTPPADEPATPDPGSPAPPAPTTTMPTGTVTWTATPSITQITAGTTPVMDVTYTWRNTTQNAYPPWWQCDTSVQYLVLSSFFGSPTLSVDTTPAGGCVLQHASVPANSELTRTVQLKLKLISGPIPLGSYYFSAFVVPNGQLTVVP